MDADPLPIVDRFTLREKTGFSLRSIMLAVDAGHLPRPRRVNGYYWPETDIPKIKKTMEKLESEGKP